MQPDGEHPRDRDDMEYELRYSIRLLDRYRNLARNADLALTLITLLGLSSAAGSLVNSNPTLATVAGGLLTVTSILHIVYKPAEAKILAAEHRKRYTDLWSRIRQLDDDSFDTQLIRLHGDDIAVPEGLRLATEIDVARELDLDESSLVKGLTFWNRLMRFCS
ncbi:hypothetical protein NPJ88_003655 [Halomonas elongata]|uniref:hypothetical protein n=1 Tax=Halomonas elongata TaxID=2746 RepID=UPI00255AAFE7|nr:hypothetical protein [Halomonas elongata]MDL4861421.1 hypothetical protein [Halomonas elongata]